MTFLIVIFVLVLQFLWLYIDDLVGKGLSLSVIFEFLGWGCATLLPLALPLATLLASIMTLGNMGEHNELLAMKSAGISLQRVLIPLIYLSVLISIGAFFISNNLIPVAYNKIYTLQYDIGRTKEEIKIPKGIFYNGIDGYTLRIEDRDTETDIMYDIMVYNHTSNKGNISLTIAESGTLKSAVDKSSLVFTLYNGTSFEETNERSYQDTTYKLQRIDFEMQEIIIPLKNYAFTKSEEERFGSEIMSKNLEQLKHDKDSLTVPYSDIRKKQRTRFFYSSGINYGNQFDSLKRTALIDKLDIDSIPKWSNATEELEAVNRALSSIGSTINLLEGYERELHQYAYPLRRIDIETYRKFTLSFACLIFFFIGAPLGAIIRKGGLGTPAIISILFFVIYWVIDISGKKLARDGAISPFFGAFISTFVLLPIGVFLTRKSMRDSSLFNIDTYKESFKKFSKRLKRFFSFYRKKREANAG